MLDSKVKESAPGAPVSRIKGNQDASFGHDEDVNFVENCSVIVILVKLEMSQYVSAPVKVLMDPQGEHPNWD